MEIRLNKMISDAGICSRREADRYIEEGRVSVNGRIPHPGQKVSETDIVLLDDIQIKISNAMLKKNPPSTAGIKRMNLNPVPLKGAGKRETEFEAEKDKASNGSRRVKYGKYNKYAAARHAAREKAEHPQSKSNKHGSLEDIFGEKRVKQALQPKFGKSLSRSAVAQRLALSPKSAALRKTSRNNPINKAKWAERNQEKRGTNNE